MLRHSKQEQQMCRKTPGVFIGYVCQQHEGRCVICDMQFDDVVPAMREVRLCTDCGFCREGDERCVMCNAKRTTEVAYYCQGWVSTCAQSVKTSANRCSAHALNLIGSVV
uniref:Uncharacterized protein n=1 Tax=Trypanosoma vivax (strain Y486) TaxID=1055687 RepID=G0U718_TRYVY|nr:conserved hypothetical protein, fragment [Trypanosoma vivax Y486]